MGLFEDIGKAIKSDAGIKALSGIIASVTAPNKEFKYTAGGSAVESATRFQQIQSEQKNREQQMLLKEKEQKSEEEYKDELLKLREQELIDDKTYKKGLLKLKEMELGVKSDIAKDKARKAGAKLPQVIKESVTAEMKALSFQDAESKVRYQNALIASKYGAPKPKRSDWFGRIKYRPKPDKIKIGGTLQKVYIGDTRKFGNDLYIYTGNNNWEPIE